MGERRTTNPSSSASASTRSTRRDTMALPVTPGPAKAPVSFCGSHICAPEISYLSGKGWIIQYIDELPPVVQ